MKLNGATARVTGISKTIRSQAPGMVPKGPGAQFAMMESDAAATLLADAVEKDRFFVLTDDNTLIGTHKNKRNSETYLNGRMAP